MFVFIPCIRELNDYAWVADRKLCVKGKQGSKKRCKIAKIRDLLCNEKTGLGFKTGDIREARRAAPETASTD